MEFWRLLVQLLLKYGKIRVHCCQHSGDYQEGSLGETYRRCTAKATLERPLGYAEGFNEIVGTGAETAQTRYFNTFKKGDLPLVFAWQCARRLIALARIVQVFFNADNSTAVPVGLGAPDVEENGRGSAEDGKQEVSGNQKGHAAVYGHDCALYFLSRSRAKAKAKLAELGILAGKQGRKGVLMETDFLRNAWASPSSLIRMQFQSCTTRRRTNNGEDFVKVGGRIAKEVARDGKMDVTTRGKTEKDGVQRCGTARGKEKLPAWRWQANSTQRLCQ